MSSPQRRYLTYGGTFTKATWEPTARYLLRDEDFASLPDSGWARGLSGMAKVGVFFGRTPVPADVMISLVDGICKKIGCEPEWLPWLHPPTRSYQRFQAREGATLGDKFRSLPHYRLIITDTYHLCVNAWRAGTPCVCVGRVDPDPRRTLADRKKEVFYSAYAADDYYIKIENWLAPDQRERIVEALAEVVSSPACASNITARMLRHRDAVEKQLAQELRAVLQTSNAHSAVP